VAEKRACWVPSKISPHVLAAAHPSALLRAPEEKSRYEEFERFVEDLRQVADLLERREAA
jgi:uracil-DNA glycosylase